RTHVLLGRNHLHLHYRLEQKRPGPGRSILKGHRSCNLKRHLRGIHVVVAAVMQSGLYIDHLVAGQYAAFHRLSNSLIHRLDVLAGNHSADYRVDEFVTGAGLERLAANLRMPVLPTAAGLPNKLAHALAEFGDRFAIGHLRTPHVGIDAEFALQAVYDDLQMQLAHAADDRLAGLLISGNLEARILRRKPLKTQTQLLLIWSCLGFDCLGDYRGWEFEGFQNDGP